MARYKDNRRLRWSDLEGAIQKQARKKAKAFVLAGAWKEFLRTHGTYKVFAVDGSWLRANLCVYFGHGGHGLVHEFIPMDEVWVSTHHYDDGDTDLSKCNCKRRTKRQKVSKNYFESTLIHEIEEHEQMKKGKPYWEAHNIALEKEREVGLLKDPCGDY